MFGSRRKHRPEKEDPFTAGRNSYIESLRAWHQKITDSQANLERSFTLDSVSTFLVNVWDDYAEGDTTFAYVEMNEVPDTVCFDVLIHLLEYAKTSQKIVDTGVKLGMRYFDSSEAYPTLIGREDAEYNLYKRWELTVSGANRETLDVIVDELAGVPPFRGKSIHVYSES